MIDVKISIRGRKSFGRWYPRPDRISIFVNKIAEYIDPNSIVFESMISAIFLHEFVHIEEYRGGCKSSKDCREGNCFWCSYILEAVEDML